MNAPVRLVNLPRCVRCGGRMMTDGTGGDSACFTCGNVVYLIPPLDVAFPKERRPSHGGSSLT
jgi:hypothetical protein